MSDTVVFIEIPAGSPNKYEFDEELGGGVLDRRLFTSMSYPAEGPDEKLICVPVGDPVWANVLDIHDVAPPYRQEIEHFFQVYKDLEEKPTETSGFGNCAEALAVLEDARARADSSS